MPWSRARALNEIGPPVEFIKLFEACFRVRREAEAAAGRQIPLVVENVRGAERWVGKARWHFGSFFLWGDVPALMPITRHKKASGQNWNRFRETGEVSPHWILQGLKMEPRNGQKADWFDRGPSRHSSRSAKRRMASAMIAKIPLPLALHIARAFKP